MLTFVLKGINFSDFGVRTQAAACYDIIWKILFFSICQLLSYSTNVLINFRNNKKARHKWHAFLSEND